MITVRPTDNMAELAAGRGLEEHGLELWQELAAVIEERLFNVIGVSILIRRVGTSHIAFLVTPGPQATAAREAIEQILNSHRNGDLFTTALPDTEVADMLTDALPDRDCIWFEGRLTEEDPPAGSPALRRRRQSDGAGKCALCAASSASPGTPTPPDVPDVRRAARTGRGRK